MNYYLGQLLLVSFSFAPRGYALCNGQILPINQNAALFALLGTMYGGDGISTFALPNLQGQTAIGVSTQFTQGTMLGSESVTLLTTQIPAHTHQLSVTAANQGLLTTPLNNFVGTGINGNKPYAASANGVMSPQALSNAGSSQPHENRSPYLTLNWIIALTGMFPTRG